MEDNSLDRLLDAASEEEIETEEVEVVEDTESSEIDVEEEFKGKFHERDSLDINNIVDEVSSSFLEYSLSVITSRALPDLRDGLKPVNRRILWTMYQSGFTPDKPHRKCAKTVGDVMGNYHPHGDSSIYEAMVRMAQYFNQRYMLVDGHGNFGNIEGDGAAAMRYTESRLAKLSLELLRDIRKDTVDMDDNFDFTLKEPHVLPSRFPNILVNGTMGIAVGMATNIPPHNLGEVIDGCVAYIDNPDIDIDGLMEYVKGPDFPTGATILGNKGIREAYSTGKGTVTIRARAEIVDEGNHQNIVITEVPYGVNTSDLKTKVGELVRNKVIEGISDYHTDLKNGVKITISLKKDVNAQVVLNNLYKHTNFQTTFSINLLMLDNGVPRTLNLKSIISKYIDHQKEVIIRRTKYDLAQDEARVHILEGLKIALDNIDEVISIIRGSLDDDEARNKLISKFGLTEIQANSILEMRLRRLTGLERDKIEAELAELLKEIDEFKAILASEVRVLGIIKEEMLDIKKRFSDERRTYIDMTAIDYIEDESLIPVEDIIVTLTDKGYIKRLTSDTYRSQHRGGVGVKGMATNEEDYVKYLINCKTHDDVLFFTDKGKVYRVRGYEIPAYSRQSKGLPIVNLLAIEKDEKISSIIKITPNKEDEDTVFTDKYLVFATKNGVVKKTPIEEFANIRNSGKIAITLREDDELISVRTTDGSQYILLSSSEGRMVVFNEEEIRPMGRTASGVKGITLENAVCTGMEVGLPDDNVLVVTSNGYGKKTFVREYRMTKRGSKGVKALNTTEKNGDLVTHLIVDDTKDLLIITGHGMIIRLPIDQISQLGRVTQGVKLINLKDNQYVSTVSVVEKEEIIEEDINNDNTSTESSEEIQTEKEAE